MNADLKFLLLHVLGGAAAALALLGIFTFVGMRMSLPMVLAGGLAAGAAIWLVRLEPSRADQLDGPPLDLDVDDALPHGQDVRVCRLEDMIHGAQPHRRMTARTLARTLAEIAAERAQDPAGHTAERPAAGPHRSCAGRGSGGCADPCDRPPHPPPPSARALEHRRVTIRS